MNNGLEDSYSKDYGTKDTGRVFATNLAYRIIYFSSQDQWKKQTVTYKNTT